MRSIWYLFCLLFVFTEKRANLFVMTLSAVTRIILMALLLSLTAATAQAEVYKHVDEDGNVSYADHPQHPGDKPINVPPPAMTFDSKPPKPTSSSTPAKPKAESKPDVTYQMLKITSPANDQAIRANGGSFPITVASRPGLNQAESHRFVVMIDGTKHQESASPPITLTNVDRGTHTISVQIQDNKGNVLASSNSVTVHVLRASIIKR
jgi:hypothetical protein